MNRDFAKEVQQVKDIYANLDELSIKEFLLETRSVEDAINRLMESNGVIEWKKAGEKAQKGPQQTTKKPFNKPYQNKQPYQKKKEEKPIVKAHKQFTPPVVATKPATSWANLQIEKEDESNKPAPKEAPKPAPVQHQAPTPVPLPVPKQISKPVQEVIIEEIKEPEIPIKKETELPREPILTLPLTLQNIKPNLDVFGIFAGPVQKPPEVAIPMMPNQYGYFAYPIPNQQQGAVPQIPQMPQMSQIPQMPGFAPYYPYPMMPQTDDPNAAQMRPPAYPPYAQYVPTQVRPANKPSTEPPGFQSH